VQVYTMYGIWACDTTQSGRIIYTCRNCDVIYVVTLVGIK